MIDILMREAEKYDFPIIVLSEDAVLRNSVSRRIRSLSHVAPLRPFDKSTRERAMLLEEGCAIAARSKRGNAILHRRFGELVFMYLPMLECVALIPSEDFFLDVSASDLSGLLSKLSVRLIAQEEISVSSFARISSIAAMLCFSEDTVAVDRLDGDGSISTEKAFRALGSALEELEFKDATELSEPPVTLSFSGGVLSMLLFGEVHYTEQSKTFTAVAPY